jgi:2-keto-4-pentenoate hydratase/2-oxohepta-3-ene-1,7-dioic acid hydratase in catechol pathway
MPPSLHPGKIVCVGRNYRDHAKELGNAVPKEPLLFLKPPSSVVGDGDAIVLPPQSSRVEYEGEIGIVIGARLSWASEDDVARAIRGVCALNDVTARDLQATDGQWTRAKGFDTFCAIGPESPLSGPITNVTVLTRLNGVERQRGSASDMVFAIPTLLAYISTVMTLEPGDVIATGTPAGVGILSDGDVVDIELPGLSRVRNPVTLRV